MNLIKLYALSLFIIKCNWLEEDLINSIARTLHLFKTIRWKSNLNEVYL